MPENNNHNVTANQVADKAVKFGITSYVNTVLIAIVGFLLNDKLSNIERQLQSIDPVKQTVTSLQIRVDINEKTIYRLQQEIDKLAAKKEDEIRISK